MDLTFPALNFKRLSQHQGTEEMNRAIETFFINLGIAHGKIYKNDKETFKKYFTELESFRGECVWIYWAYRMHGLCEEVLPEPGESKERLIGRKILEVFKVIIQ